MRSLVLVVLALTVASCSSVTADPVASDPCGRRVAEAADAISIREQVALLDEAIYLCGYLSTFSVEVDANSGVLNIPVADFVRRRCELSSIDGTRATPMCTEVASPE